MGEILVKFQRVAIVWLARRRYPDRCRPIHQDYFDFRCSIRVELTFSAPERGLEGALC
jgi:hypothetical protein